MFLSEVEVLRRAVATINEIMQSDDYCTMDAINGVLKLLNAMLEKEED